MSAPPPGRGRARVPVAARRALAVSLGVAPIVLTAPRASAQAYPARPLRLVVPFPPGSAADLVARSLGQRVQVGLGQTVVVENRPGAAGAIGADAVAKATADGHTVLSHVSSVAINPHLAKPPFDILTDFAPVTQTVAGSYVLVVQPSFPASSLREFIAHVRRQPGRLNYASYGNGSGPHLAMELLKTQAGLFIVHVPFRGAAPAMQELLAGRVDMAFDTTLAALPHIRAGRLKAIAVGGPRPVDALPGVETVAATFAGFDTDGWQAIFVPAATPREVVARLHAEFVKAVRAPEFAAQMAGLGFVAVGSTPEQLAAILRADHDRWGRLIRERRIQAD